MRTRRPVQLGETRPPTYDPNYLNPSSQDSGPEFNLAVMFFIGKLILPAALQVVSLLGPGSHASIRIVFSVAAK